MRIVYYMLVVTKGNYLIAFFLKFLLELGCRELSVGISAVTVKICFIKVFTAVE